LRLAKIEQPGVWRLEPDWQQSLKDLGEYQDVLDRLRPLVGDRAIGFQIVDERSSVPAFEGRVIGKGLDDLLSRPVRRGFSVTLKWTIRLRSCTNPILAISSRNFLTSIR